MIGTAIGVAAGHILLPTIIYNGEKERILLPGLELHFYPFKTLLATCSWSFVHSSSCFYGSQAGVVKSQPNFFFQNLQHLVLRFLWSASPRFGTG